MTAHIGITFESNEKDMWQENNSVSKVIITSGSISLVVLDAMICNQFQNSGPGTLVIQDEILMLNITISDKEDLLLLKTILQTAELELNDRVQRGRYDKFKLSYKSIIVDIAFIDSRGDWKIQDQEILNN